MPTHFQNTYRNDFVGLVLQIFGDIIIIYPNTIYYNKQSNSIKTNSNGVMVIHWPFKKQSFHFPF